MTAQTATDLVLAALDLSRPVPEMDNDRDSDPRFLCDVLDACQVAEMDRATFEATVLEMHGDSITLSRCDLITALRADSKAKVERSELCVETETYHLITRN